MKDRAIDFGTIVLWLFVIDLGIAVGAGLYETRIVLPDWLDTAGTLQWNAETARRDDTGRRFWVWVTTVPLTLLTVANLWLAWRASSEARSWWLAAGTVALVERALTLGYFIPTMVALTRDGSPDATSTALRWTQLNSLRHVLVAVAWLAALRALTALYLARGRARNADPVLQSSMSHLS